MFPFYYQLNRQEFFLCTEKENEQIFKINKAIYLGNYSHFAIGAFLWSLNLFSVRNVHKICLQKWNIITIHIFLLWMKRKGCELFIYKNWRSDAKRLIRSHFSKSDFNACKDIWNTYSQVIFRYRWYIIVNFSIVHVTLLLISTCTKIPIIVFFVFNSE